MGQKQEGGKDSTLLFCLESMFVGKKNYLFGIKTGIIMEGDDAT